MQATYNTLKLVHDTPSPARVKKAKRPHSIFRNWLEQTALHMASLELYLDGVITPHVIERFRQLNRRFIRVQNDAYLCCVALEGKGSDLRKERAAYRIPRLMWVMIQIRKQTEKLVSAAE